MSEFLEANPGYVPEGWEGRDVPPPAVAARFVAVPRVPVALQPDSPPGRAAAPADDPRDWRFEDAMFGGGGNRAAAAVEAGQLAYAALGYLMLGAAAAATNALFSAAEASVTAARDAALAAHVVALDAAAAQLTASVNDANGMRSWTKANRPVIVEIPQLIPLPMPRLEMWLLDNGTGILAATALLFAAAACAVAAPHGEHLASIGRAACGALTLAAPIIGQMLLLFVLSFLVKAVITQSIPSVADCTYPFFSMFLAFFPRRSLLIQKWRPQLFSAHVFDIMANQLRALNCAMTCTAMSAGVALCYFAWNYGLGWQLFYLSNSMDVVFNLVASSLCILFSAGLLSVDVFRSACGLPCLRGRFPKTQEALGLQLLLLAAFAVSDMPFPTAWKATSASRLDFGSQTANIFLRDDFYLLPPALTASICCALAPALAGCSIGRACAHLGMSRGTSGAAVCVTVLATALASLRRGSALEAVMP